MKVDGILSWEPHVRSKKLITLQSIRCVTKSDTQKKKRENGEGIKNLRSVRTSLCAVLKIMIKIFLNYQYRIFMCRNYLYSRLCV